MLNIPRYIQVLLVLLVFTMVAVSLVYVWMPEYMSKETFFKILISFGVVFAGSTVLAILRKVLPPATEKSKKAN